MVRGARHGRRGVVAHDVQQEPRSTVGGRRRRRVFPGRVAPCRHRTAAVGRPIHRGWAAVGSVGESEQVSAARGRGAVGARGAGRTVEGGTTPPLYFHGDGRRIATHQSTTDPDARLYKKAVGREARLGYLGHVLMEHRSGLLVNTMVTPADGYGGR